jgi:arabinan endo-1,5-alpha-L-arabinosidase
VILSHPDSGKRRSDRVVGIGLRGLILVACSCGPSNDGPAATDSGSDSKPSTAIDAGASDSYVSPDSSSSPDTSASPDTSSSSAPVDADLPPDAGTPSTDSGTPALEAGTPESSTPVGASTDGGVTASGGVPPRPYVNNGAACGGTATWANKSTQSMPDPSMTKQGNTYYTFGTGGGYVTSTDLVTWARGGSIFPNGLPSWTKQYISDPALWAPDVHLEKGTYYCYYAISAWDNYDSSVGLATSTSPAGPWTDHGDVVDYKTGGSGVNVIDPDLFVDDNGTWWLIYGSYKSGLRLIALDPSTGKALNGTPSPTVITSSLGEGSDIIQHNGYYYVFASRGECCAGLKSTYQIAEGRSKTVTGPYLGSNGVNWGTSPYTLFLTGDADHPGVGGQSFFRDVNDQLYMVYMAYTAPTGDAILNVRPMWFDANDWPTLDPCKAATY